MYDFRLGARLLRAVGFSFFILLGIPALAGDARAITIADMAGKWQMTFSGFTGCGNVAMLFTVTLGSDGKGTDGLLTQHGQCGDLLSHQQSFQIFTLDANGSGTAGMSCGDGCGWNLTIQVAPHKQAFNMVDVAQVNPGNYISGTAIRQLTH